MFSVLSTGDPLHRSLQKGQSETCLSVSHPARVHPWGGCVVPSSGQGEARAPRCGPGLRPLSLLKDGVCGHPPHHPPFPVRGQALQHTRRSRIFHP